MFSKEFKKAQKTKNETMKELVDRAYIKTGVKQKIMNACVDQKNLIVACGRG